MFCCLSNVLNKIKNIPYALLCRPFCSWVLVGPMAWPCSSWISLGRPSQREADVCLLVSCCLWSSQPPSCSSESEVTTEPDGRLDFIICAFTALHLSCPLTDFRQALHDTKNLIFYYILYDMNCFYLQKEHN